MDKTSLIELKNINYSYPGGRQVLSGLNWTFSCGDRLGITGANGAGKTTLFHLCMGLIQPDSGEIFHLKNKICKEKDFALMRKNIGMLFQNADDQLFCPTVLEDVAFGPLNLGKTPDQAKDISMSVLKTLGLEGFENRVTYRLSGGEKKLVSLATVLAMEPMGLLLDEPTNDLDPNTRDRLIDILNNLPYEMGLAIISHDLDFLSRTTKLRYNVEVGEMSGPEPWE